MARTATRAERASDMERTALMATPMARHTRGPWGSTWREQFLDGTLPIMARRPHPRTGVEPIADMIYLDGGERTAEKFANAKLVMAAPAMYLALRLVMAGEARIEGVEFCFDGIRYSVPDGDNWNAIFDNIGWEKAERALANARGYRSR